MKIITLLKDIDLSDSPLPKGYSIRLMRDTEEDQSTWDYLQSHFRKTKLPKGEKSIGVFVFYWDVPVGALGVTIQKSGRDEGAVGYMTAGIVLEEHRRKGVYKKMNVFLLKYCEEMGVETIRLAVRENLDGYWKRILG